MLKKLKLFLLIIMISFLGNKVSADYDKLAYDFKFKDLDGSTLNVLDVKVCGVKKRIHNFDVL